jgi:hypothetical protein
VPVYGLLLLLAPGVAFLHHMAITFIVLVTFMVVWTRLRPLPESEAAAAVLRQQESPASEFSLEPARGARGWALAVVATTAVLYAVFW